MSHYFLLLSCHICPNNNNTFLICFHVCIVHRTFIAHWWASTGSPSFLWLRTIKKLAKRIPRGHWRCPSKKIYIRIVFYRKLKTRIRIKSIAIAFVEFQIPSVRWSTIQQTLFPVFIFLRCWLMYYRLFCVELSKKSSPFNIPKYNLGIWRPLHKTSAIYGRLMNLLWCCLKNLKRYHKWDAVHIL